MVRFFSPQAIGSWLLLPATAKDNKKIHSILRAEAKRSEAW
jgi:hypothetical protein